MTLQQRVIPIFFMVESNDASSIPFALSSNWTCKTLSDIIRNDENRHKIWRRAYVCIYWYVFMTMTQWSYLLAFIWYLLKTLLLRNKNSLLLSINLCKASNLSFKPCNFAAYCEMTSLISLAYPLLDNLFQDVGNWWSFYQTEK